MIHFRVFVLAVSAIYTGAVMSLACGDGEPRASLIDESDAADTHEASLPPVSHDAGLRDKVAAPSKPDYDASDEPVVCTSIPCVTQLVAGADHFCALLSDGSVRCWGLDYRGSLGRGVTQGGDNTGSPPMPVAGITAATQISASSLGTTTCARNVGGRVRCWGENTYGQLGLQVLPALADNKAHATPADVALAVEIARVDVGPNSVCALGANGSVYCWGSNAERQLARPDAGEGNIHGPGVADLGNYKITRVVLGQGAVFGLTTDRQVVGWGTVSGRNSSLVNTSVPFPLPSLSDVTSVDTSVNIYTGGSFGCAVAGGRVYCWGDNRIGVLGIGDPDNQRLPTLAEITADDKIFPQQLALAQNRSCVRMTDGTIQCCGKNQLGQLGEGDAGPVTSVFGRAAAFEEHAVQVAVSTNTTCALVQGGKVVCWGGNKNGELGQGTRDSVAHPIPVPVVFQ